MRTSLLEMGLVLTAEISVYKMCLGCHLKHASARSSHIIDTFSFCFLCYCPCRTRECMEC